MSAKRFKVGDKVKVRRDLIIGKFYGNVRCNNSMERMVGKVFTIRNVDEQYYKVTENEWNWSDGMLEPVEKTLDDLCAGDFIAVRIVGTDVTAKILASLDGCYLISCTNDFDTAGSWYTVADPDEFRYRPVKSDTPEPTIEIDGKKYNKADVEEVIKDLEPIE